MKHIILLSVLYAATALGAASRGAITEGLFIVKNKHRDVKEEIQEFKKELTACCVSTQGKSSELDVYHCKLKQLLYPGYIDELGRLISYADKQLAGLNEDAIEQAVLDKIVGRAILLIDKIRLEKQLLQSTFDVDRKLKQLSVLMKKQDPREKEQIKLSELKTLKEAIKKGKQQIIALKKRIQTVNGNLFNGVLTQEVFLDKLAYYTP